MNILILHQHFRTPATGGAIRSYYLAQALMEAGHRPIVITAHNESRYAQTTVDGIEIHYLPVKYDNAFSFTKRVWSFARFFIKSLSLARRLMPFDVCYAISVPLTTGLTAGYIRRSLKVPYLFEVGDLWPDAPVQMGFVKNPLLARTLFALEKNIYRRAKSVVALSPAIATAIQKKTPGVTVHTIPNMSDCDYFKPEIKNEEVARKLGVQGKFVISYIGAIGLANGLDHFIECANLARKNNMAVHFFMAGEGALLERLKKNAEHLRLTNVTFTGKVNREGVRQLMSVTDAVFVSYKNLPILETGSPNKYFDGLAAGKLIIINFGGWIQKEVEEHRCGIRLSSSNPVDFPGSIRRFMDDQALLSSYQQASRRLAESKYSRKKLTEQWVRIVTG